MDAISKLCKNLKALHEAELQRQHCEENLVKSLDGLAGVNASNCIVYDSNLETKSAWLQFCILFKDLSVLSQFLARNLQNGLIFPLENIIKSNTKNKSSSKAIDRAFKEYESKMYVLRFYNLLCSEPEKDSRSGVSGEDVRCKVSQVDVAEALSKERTVLQYEICEVTTYLSVAGLSFYNSGCKIVVFQFLLKMSKLNNKKTADLVEYMVDFYHSLDHFYREGQKTMNKFRTYIDSFVPKLNETKRQQEKEWKMLSELCQTLRKSQFMTDYDTNKHNSSQESSMSGVPVIVGADAISISTTKCGYLWKRSKNKMHRSWNKRRCEVRDGVFFIWHLDKSLPPTEISLLTCYIKPIKDDDMCFEIICRDRKLYLQAENRQQALE
ncbi:unnamed protein product [Soboliphyme baturini]|uniref:PH domain-containing protein n=1 Tax=Soboliphyme baturini TaxID=241478 RepID=A0A183IL24_9BILA|nr:unnamed protein product [Soboliphyme baturini]